MQQIYKQSCQSGCNHIFLNWQSNTFYEQAHQLFSQISFITAIPEKQEILPDQINFIVLHRLVHKTKENSQFTEYT